ncbi:UNVERIFIED_CONTAM: hypothetical protein Sangu_2872300 [Sesamum angustifolium]|uniref:Secreted protein n=1 Tax=Sesamum angustifolium TaxID=2727405 RepID=A0AAW2IQ74_9LAMI
MFVGLCAAISANWACGLSGWGDPRTELELGLVGWSSCCAGGPLATLGWPAASAELLSLGCTLWLGGQGWAVCTQPLGLPN